MVNYRFTWLILGLLWLIIGLLWLIDGLPWLIIGYSGYNYQFTMIWLLLSVYHG